MSPTITEPGPEPGPTADRPEWVAAFPYCLRWDAGGLITATGPGWGARGREWVGQRWDRIFRRQPGPGIRAGGEPEVLTLAALAAATPSLHGPRLAQPDGGSLFLGTPLPPDPGPEPRRSERRTLLTDSRRPPAGTCLRLVEAVWQCLTAAGGAPDLLASLPASLGQPAGASLVQVFQLGPDGRPDLPLAEWTAPGLTAEPLAALRAQLDARRKVSLASGLYSLEGVVPGPAPQLVVLAFPLGDGQSGLVLLALPAEAGRVAEAEASVPLLGQLLGQCLGRNRAERAWADERSLTQNVLELLGQAKASRKRLSSRLFDQVPADVDQDRLERAFAMIFRHYREPLRQAEVARSLNLTPDTFSRLFKRHCGNGFTQCLIEYRVAIACRLLQETGLQVTEIGERCGFRNLANFNRQFLKLKNCSPRTWRNRWK